MSDTLNHEFDDKQKNINWEDHKGLCHLAAGKMCKREPKLRQFYEDIVCDLELKLWWAAEKANFDPSKGRFSTYAMMAMMRTYRDVVKMYTNRNPNTKERPLVFSFYEPGDGKDFVDSALVDYKTSPLPDETVRLATVCLDMMPLADREFLQLYYKHMGHKGVANHVMGDAFPKARKVGQSRERARKMFHALAIQGCTSVKLFEEVI